MKKYDPYKRLVAEAERYTALAKDSSLYILKNPNDAAVEKHRRKAQDHLLRAETFMAAAALLP